MTKQPKTAAFNAVMPVHSFEGDKVVFKDGRVAVGFRVEPAEMESWTSDDYETFQTALVGVLRPLPVGTIVQKTDIYYDRPYREDKTQQTYFENKMNKHFFERLVLFQKSYLFLSFAPVAVKSPKTNAVNALVARAGEAVLKNPFAQLVHTLEAAESGAVEFIQGIKNLGGVTFERLQSAEIHQLYLQYFNLNFDGQPTRQEREIGNDLGTFSVGEHKVNVLSMVGQGSDAYPAVRNGYGVTAPMLYPLTHILQCPHVLTQALLIQDTRAELSSLDTDRKLNASLSFLATQDNHLRAAEVEEFTAEVRAENKQIVGLHLSCVLWDTNDTSRRENVERATAAFRYMFGTESVVESYLALPVFFGLLPGNAWQVPDRWLTSTADRGSCYTHWTATYKTDPVGEFLTDRFRNLVQVNLFNTALDNQNAIVIGPSGSGKSYTFGNLIVQRFEKGARQIIMDVGGTYRNVLQSLNGEDFDNTYFEYDPQRPIEFNPFVVPRDAAGKWLYNDEKTNFHLALLAALWKGGKDTALDKSERTILSRFLIEYYACLNESPRLNQKDEEFPGMESFYRFVEQYDQEMQKPVAQPGDGVEPDPLDGARRQYQKNLKYIDMHQFFLVLGQYITGGRYERVLNAQRDVDLSEYRLICFDLAKVQADPDLYPVVAMLITELSLDLFRRFPDDIKYIALDEAWTMLSGVLSEFIESMYRTIRKTNGSVTIITQGITEITSSKIGPAIINNSATKIILRHVNPDSLTQLQAPLGLTGHEMDLIKSVRSTEALREFFIKQGAKGKVFALEASPQLDAILTSKPVERNHLNKLVKFYQQTQQRPRTDKNGHVLLNDEGQMEYEPVRVQRLDYAVDQFVEDKQARKGALAS
ncbi:type IV secretion system protein VirB4 [Hymenobacter sp. BT770]|uniref:TraG/VirB4 family ATPase n=1 Tax=Hymenobacter sp. BT770 TaxID=2886942 RepID=UPI001D12FB31|nr:type IV secretion system protein VirB4 [Hymenobacter sp. BT770]MCC3154750.1 type IV secretion system protein VirB4 [Hymenobacter sp. BT770]MDO3416535.1 type IV secretion system protein VirB4 [Hymenobacter sp. BT770]